MVMVLIGLVALISVPRLENLPNTRAQFAAYRLQSDLRYAQLLAIESQARVRSVFDTSASTYQLERETTPGVWTSVVNPATRQNFTGTLNSGDFAGVTFSQASINGTSTVIFDSLGSPFDASGNALTEPSQVDLNSKFRLRFRLATGKIDILAL